MMSKPLLQLALDHTDLTLAQRDVTILKDHVDIVEAGTILCLAEGIHAVRELRQQCPTKIVVADWKVADAAEILAHQAFKSGANWMTVICAAPLATIQTAHRVAQEYQHHHAEIQIELFGHWSFDDARAWVKSGIGQAIYHRGRDAQASGQQWGKEDLDKMKKLSDLGLQLSITGGITPDDLHLFKDISVKAFIAGRALSNAKNPHDVANAFHHHIQTIWGNV
ncbi:3-keto-L-gulonate-6-phosphate decarboxylase UlaD [Commensalibacter oyaizuii]|uniref:3-keto-L-gulonate-6-phosphate decarboxylase UlaD n=1 Tax=Commensalibacter oyaizuii TaxID=3043873 RepID=A0ABT6Q2A4_9PROT|nr:3-keto-L-gulonate-6-phosphate decarboxylase UlaD [Commensalibacter sp. TBRC 16381]MDI2091242.1 3-keto-L-gulonate-6-phosphate decarboxylase UlaD [Commensalibacter sp. TBRC 16381]